MACEIQRPAPQTLFNRIRDMFSNSVLGGAPVIPESNEWYVVANDYAMTEEFYAIADQQYKELHAETACCENLLKMAADDGVYPRPATFANAYVAITGEPGSALPSTIEITSAKGNFATVGNVPALMPASGCVTLRVKAIIPGPLAVTSKPVTTGSLVTNPGTLDSVVTFAGGTFCGGQEAEQCEPFRERYIARRKFKPRASAEWIKEKILEWPCVTRVCDRGGECCFDSDCCGCADCNANTSNGFYAIFDSTFECGIAPENLIAELDEWMFGFPKGRGLGQASVGICGTVHAVTAGKVNVVIDFTDCWTTDQINSVRVAVIDMFTTLCPSQEVKDRQVTVAIADIVGAESAYDIYWEPQDENTKINDCNSLVPNCDVLPCLNELIFKGPSTGGDACL